MIERKLKQCIECEEGRLSILWRSNPPLCKKHSFIRTAKKQIEEGKASKQTYDDFCRALWKSRPHVSQLSGKPLPEYDPHSPKFCNLIRFHMHHMKQQGQEGKSKKQLGITLDETKIIFVTAAEHHIIEYGSDKQKEEIGWNTFVKNHNQ